jgi:hypothetical protein
MREELFRIQQALKMPVSNISFQNGYVSLYCGNKHIGNINASGNADEMIYDTTEEAVKTLDWSCIYQQYHNDIHNKVRLLFDNTITDAQITVGPFGKLYVRQDDQSVRTVQCAFTEGEWHLSLYDF